MAGISLRHRIICKVLNLAQISVGVYIKLKRHHWPISTVRICQASICICLLACRMQTVFGYLLSFLEVLFQAQLSHSFLQ